MIGEQQKNAVFAALFSAITVLLLAWYVFISYDYPYYFIWDMDHITALDTVLIQSGLRPDHICHPGFGMNLLLFFSEKIAHLFGVVSALDLEELAGSINPLAAMAELTTFVRLHSPFLSVGIAILLSMAMYLMSGMSRWYLLFFLVFLGMQESLAYHSSMVRTELYSVFYWSGAVLAMTMAAKATSPISRGISLLATGFLLGLSFLTKIQSLFYLAVVPILLLLAFSLLQDSPKQNRRNITRKGAFWILIVSLFNVTAFLILGIASYSISWPHNIPSWASTFRVTPIAVLFFLVLLSLLLCQLLLYLTNRLSLDIFRFSSFLSIVAAGFILSFASHFLLYLDAAVSLNYTLLNFKIMFLRVPKLLKIPEPSVYASNFLLHLRYNPMLLIVNIALNLLLVFGYLRKFVRAGDVSSLASEEIVQTPKIILRNAGQSVGLEGLEIKNYSEIPLDKIAQKFFFVIRKI